MLELGAFAACATRAECESYPGESRDAATMSSAKRTSHGQPRNALISARFEALGRLSRMSHGVWKRYRFQAASIRRARVAMAAFMHASIALRRTLTSLTYSMHPITDGSGSRCIDRTLASVRSHRRAAWARVAGKRHNESRQSRQRGTRQPIRASCESPSFDPRCRRARARGERGESASPGACPARAGACRSGARCRSGTRCRSRSPCTRRRAARPVDRRRRRGRRRSRDGRARRRAGRGRRADGRRKRPRQRRPR